MGPISLFKKQKNEISVILLTAVTFALGINLISSSIPSIINHQTVYLIIGIILLLLSLYGINLVLWSGVSKTIRIRGAVAFEIKDNEVVKKKIFGYRFNSEFLDYLLGFLNENQAYKKLFTKTEKREIKKSSSFNPDEINLHSIMNSVLELIYLKHLQNHINAYFTENEIDRQRITTLSRSDLDASILKNRVLDLITRDMKERAAFIQHYDDNEDNSNKGVVVFAQGENGAIYQRFSLELPPKSVIRRNSNGFLEIESKLFKMTFRPRFEGYSTFIPPDLVDTNKIFAPHLISMSLDILVKKTLFIRDVEFEIYEWLDSFLDELESFISSDMLTERANLELIHLLRREKSTAVPNKNLEDKENGT